MRAVSPLCLALFVAIVSVAAAGDSSPQSPAERGKETLLGRVFTTPIWSDAAYENVWKQWGLARKPENYAEAVASRYGLHAAPFANHGLPMGMRITSGLLGGKMVTNDCLLCHGGSIFGKSYIGLGNAALDMQALYEELAAADGRTRKTPFPFSNTRGTTEAAAMAVYLFQFRDAELKVGAPVDLGLKADMCEDTPAWWLLKKKKTMYWTGSTPSRSVRSIMQFALSPLHTAEMIQSWEPAFADIQAYILSLEPPKYPLAIDEGLATRGEAIFQQNCSKCHGTYGPDWTYPNKFIPLEQIGTDPARADGISVQAEEHYLKTWFGKERQPDGKPYEHCRRRGYQPPPLDGIWATAPYFHNGSAPTLYHVLNSTTRPKYFTRSYRTGADDYDAVNVGWKVTVLDSPADPKLPGIERRKIYDTTQRGRGNGGHTFGDKLSDAERVAVIEYLKKL